MLLLAISIWSFNVYLYQKTKESANELKEVQGKCYCGSVAFSVQVPDEKELKEKKEDLMAAWCCCDSCKRAHAAPFYQSVYLPSRFLTILRGKDTIVDFTPKNFTRHFCKKCGSRVFNSSKAYPNEIGFFPPQLTEQAQKHLPKLFRPTACLDAKSLTINIDQIASLIHSSKK